MPKFSKPPSFRRDPRTLGPRSSPLQWRKEIKQGWADFCLNMFARLLQQQLLWVHPKGGVGVWWQLHKCPTPEKGNLWTGTESLTLPPRQQVIATQLALSLLAAPGKSICLKSDTTHRVSQTHGTCCWLSERTPLVFWELKVQPLSEGFYL